MIQEHCMNESNEIVITPILIIHEIAFDVESRSNSSAYVKRFDVPPG
jgi:hypothetical protein